ncbi:MAG: FG-GAP repeat protein, partial [Spirochaetia bacterium]|nr:FG-GAP repeat protein [Spirochaetia bacterium]
MKKRILKSLGIFFFLASVIWFIGCMATPIAMARPIIWSLITMSLGLFVSYCSPAPKKADTTTTTTGSTAVCGDGICDASESTASCPGDCPATVDPNAERAWVQDAYLKATNAGAYDNFGGSVSISGDFIAVSATGEANSNTAIQNTDNTNPVADDALAGSSGAVYVFKRNTSTGDWSQDAYLKASNAQAVDWLGSSISISGNIIAVGAIGEDNSNTAIQNTDNANPVADDALANMSGAVYVFKRNTTTGDWSQDAYLKASNAQASDFFGNTVSISGNIIAVGARGEDNSNTAIQNTDNALPAADDALASTSGAVYVFKRNTSTGDWSQDAYLKASNAEAGDCFGMSVSISGDIIAVGAANEANSNTAIQNTDNANPVADNALAAFSGAVYVF